MTFVMSLVSDNIIPTVNSAAAEEFLPGVSATVMFLFLHASISIFTGPPLETPIYFRLEV